MKRLCFIITLLATHGLYAQGVKQTTDAFLVTGKVRAEKNISLADLQRYPAVELKNVNTSCSPKKEERIRRAKAVLLKNILDSVSFQYESPRMLHQYYFLFVAADGYKLVYSYNEIYNTETGNNLYVVTEMDGRKMDEMDNRILVLTTKDIRGGIRNMKWLQKIVVCSAE